MKTIVRKVAEAVIFFLCLTVGCSTVAAEEGAVLGDAPGRIKGKIVVKDGKPLDNGIVAFFKSDGLEPMDYSHTRRSPTMVAFLDGEGIFATTEMPAGSYYIGALPRDKWTGGPPRPGEKRYSAIDEKGKYKIVTLARAQTLDVGTITVEEPGAFAELADFFTVEGKIVDADGKGVAGAVVVVKKNYDAPKSDFISEPTKADGSYQLKLPPGKYYVLAREAIVRSGRPNPDSAMGELGQNKPIGIGGQRDSPPVYLLGESGKYIKDVDIVMFKVPVPEVKRAEMEAQVRSNKVDKKSLPENLPLSKRRVDSGEASSQYKGGKAESTEKPGAADKADSKPAPGPASK